MAEPKKRLTSTRSGNRQSKDGLKLKSLSQCSHCKQSVIPHTVCLNCGYYAGKKILEVKSEKAKSKKESEDLKDE
jgi:large subunit ribosomal protein L32